MYYPVISDAEGLSLTADEKSLFKALKPTGFILFQRNCDNPTQVKALTQEMKDCVGRDDIPILIDQEGGRVARLKPPHWKQYPSAQAFSNLYEVDRNLAVAAVQVNANLMATQLLSLGINVDCYPVLDILFDGADKVIGDRAFGRDPQKITDLARAATEGLLSCGVIPIIKHIPGHGRADVDSHKDLPIVKTALSELKETDFIPFKNLSDLPCAMTAHVIYEDIDPKKCATISSKVIKKIIRKEIGFNGVLFSDDVTMKALKSGSAKNATEALKAGCDLVIHCNAPLKEREEVLLATKKYMINSDSWIWSKFKGRSIPREIDHDKLYAWLLSVVDGY